ncbi:hypothetical protein HXX76_000646 [Chlamydomonas incerta]|uniref:Uncharacterized protein n=1 Tax=Chlamydomonas incerta TaxID=51695 RepID=A0A835WEZ1_CHLIN|nr:hypothetical protein HXX76_000646 [Chlamydomonas incerta]|eukprot:KAG2446044.1 hypothetical protein HXX76_000646 [Chlamydomonas incerta]
MSRPEVTAQFAATIYGSLDELGHNMAVQHALATKAEELERSYEVHRYEDLMAAARVPDPPPLADGGSQPGELEPVWLRLSSPDTGFTAAFRRMRIAQHQQQQLHLGRMQPPGGKGTGGGNRGGTWGRPSAARSGASGRAAQQQRLREQQQEQAGGAMGSVASRYLQLRSQPPGGGRVGAASVTPATGPVSTHAPHAPHHVVFLPSAIAGGLVGGAAAGAASAAAGASISRAHSSSRLLHVDGSEHLQLSAPASAQLVLDGVGVCPSAGVAPAGAAAASPFWPPEHTGHEAAAMLHHEEQARSAAAAGLAASRCFSPTPSSIGPREAAKHATERLAGAGGGGGGADAFTCGPAAEAAATAGNGGRGGVAGHGPVARSAPGCGTPAASSMARPLQWRAFAKATSSGSSAAAAPDGSLMAVGQADEVDDDEQAAVAVGGGGGGGDGGVHQHVVRLCRASMALVRSSEVLLAELGLGGGGDHDEGDDGSSSGSGDGMDKHSEDGEGAEGEVALAAGGCRQEPAAVVTLPEEWWLTEPGTRLLPPPAGTPSGTPQPPPGRPRLTSQFQWPPPPPAPQSAAAGGFGQWMATIRAMMTDLDTSMEQIRERIEECQGAPAGDGKADEDIDQDEVARSRSGSNASRRVTLMAQHAALAEQRKSLAVAARQLRRLTCRMSEPPLAGGTGDDGDGDACDDGGDGGGGGGGGGGWLLGAARRLRPGEDGVEGLLVGAAEELHGSGLARGSAGASDGTTAAALAADAAGRRGAAHDVWSADDGIAGGGSSRYPPHDARVRAALAPASGDHHITWAAPEPTAAASPTGAVVIGDNRGGGASSGRSSPARIRPEASGPHTWRQPSRQQRQHASGTTGDGASAFPATSSASATAAVVVVGSCSGSGLAGGGSRSGSTSSKSLQLGVVGCRPASRAGGDSNRQRSLSPGIGGASSSSSSRNSRNAASGSSSRSTSQRRRTDSRDAAGAAAPGAGNAAVAEDGESDAAAPSPPTTVTFGADQVHLVQASDRGDNDVDSRGLQIGDLSLRSSSRGNSRAHQHTQQPQQPQQPHGPLSKFDPTGVKRQLSRTHPALGAAPLAPLLPSPPPLPAPTTQHDDGLSAQEDQDQQSEVLRGGSRVTRRKEEGNNDADGSEGLPGAHSDGSGAAAASSSTEPGVPPGPVTCSMLRVVRARFARGSNGYSGPGGGGSSNAGEGAWRQSPNTCAHGGGGGSLIEVASVPSSPLGEAAATPAAAAAAVGAAASPPSPGPAGSTPAPLLRPGNAGSGSGSGSTQPEQPWALTGAPFTPEGWVAPAAPAGQLLPAFASTPLLPSSAPSSPLRSSTYGGTQVSGGGGSRVRSSRFGSRGAAGSTCTSPVSLAARSGRFSTPPGSPCATSLLAAGGEGCGPASGGSGGLVGALRGLQQAPSPSAAALGACSGTEAAERAAAPGIERGAAQVATAGVEGAASSSNIVVRGVRSCSSPMTARRVGWDAPATAAVSPPVAHAAGSPGGSSRGGGAWSVGGPPMVVTRLCGSGSGGAAAGSQAPAAASFERNNASGGGGSGKGGRHTSSMMATSATAIQQQAAGGRQATVNGNSDSGGGSGVRSLSAGVRPASSPVRQPQAAGLGGGGGGGGAGAALLPPSPSGVSVIASVSSSRDVDGWGWGGGMRPSGAAANPYVMDGGSRSVRLTSAPVAAGPPSSSRSSNRM